MLLVFDRDVVDKICSNKGIVICNTNKGVSHN